MITLDKLLPPVRRIAAPLAAADYAGYDAVLQVVAKWGSASVRAPHDTLLAAVQKRRKDSKDGKAAVQATLRGGTLVSRVALSAADDAFQMQTALRKALAPLLAGSPRTLAVDVRRPAFAEQAVYSALVAAAALPSACPAVTPPRITVAGVGNVKEAQIAAQANTLTRALTAMPPNQLTPSTFAAVAQKLARQAGISTTLYTLPQLKKLGAGAIAAVGQAAKEQPPRLLRLSYAPRGATTRVALVGKGVCYDTGGVNVKPARYMRGMGKDMSGAAVALSGVLAAAQQRLRHGVDAWLILAENNIASNAYRPDDVITAANGKRIEVVHSDAEGRMLLSDTLVLAARRKPDLMITYATLTGTMHMALGEGMSGFFATHDAWRKRALNAAEASGDRLCYFPMPADYKAQLKSNVADIKQCSEAGEADHILAALFLREFMPERMNWLHLDLSAAENKKGLAAAPGGATGFGAAWTLALLSAWKPRK